MVKIGQTSKESEASEVVDKARPLCGTYTDTQSKVVLSESLNEEKHKQYQKGSENTKEKKEAAGTMVEKDLSDLKPEVSGEDELLKKADCKKKKGDAEKEFYLNSRESAD